MDADFSVATSA